MPKLVRFFIVTCFAVSGCNSRPQSESVRFIVSVDMKCEASIRQLAGFTTSLDIEDIKLMMLNKLVIDQFDIDTDLVKSLLPDIDFSKKILDVDEGKRIDQVVSEQGPWALKRKIYVGDGELIDCSFSKEGVLMSSNIVKSPKTFLVEYTVVNEN